SFGVSILSNRMRTFPAQAGRGVKFPPLFLNHLSPIQSGLHKTCVPLCIGTAFELVSFAIWLLGIREQAVSAASSASYSWPSSFNTLSTTQISPCRNWMTWASSWASNPVVTEDSESQYSGLM